MVAPTYRNSARNLLHYLSVRQRDIRPLQLDLHSLGLSSLGILEGHVLAAINAVVSNLEVLAGEDAEPAPQPPATFVTGPILLHDHTRRLFGPAPPSRTVRIMVTMPSEAADDPQLIEDLLRAGMDVMRMNCAHDGADAWRRMASHLRRAERIVGKPCRIQADLAGPKLRTGPLRRIGHMLRLRPAVDALGRTVRPARAWFTLQEDPEPGPGDAVAVPIASATAAWRRGKTLVTEDLRVGTAPSASWPPLIGHCSPRSIAASIWHRAPCWKRWMPKAPPDNSSSVISRASSPNKPERG